MNPFRRRLDSNPGENSKISTTRASRSARVPANAVGGSSKKSHRSSDFSRTDYRPLNAGMLEIRLLKIRPEFENGPESMAKEIDCSLETVSLLQQPTYEALSYCWGTGPAASRIRIGGSQFRVTDSLAAALLQLRKRHADGSFHLWVDFICIDQNNKDEKAHQILLMDRIFGRASIVYGWLGPSPANADLVLDILEEMAQSIAPGPGMTDAVRNLLRKCFSPLSKNPFWRRVWIIQELATPEKLIVLWGSYEISWSILHAASSSADYQSLSLSADCEALAALREFRSQERDIHRASARMSLLDALIQSRFALATEPRDKIFALLGLTCDGRDVMPLPNYEQSNGDIYIELANGIVVRQQNFAAIFLAKRTTSIASKLPSWVPDWSALDIYAFPWILNAVRTRHVDWRAYPISLDHRLLSIACRTLDLVEAVFLAPFCRSERQRLSIPTTVYFSLVDNALRAQLTGESIWSFEASLIFNFFCFCVDHNAGVHTPSTFEEWEQIIMQSGGEKINDRETLTPLLSHVSYLVSDALAGLAKLDPTVQKDFDKTDNIVEVLDRSKLWLAVTGRGDFLFVRNGVMPKDRIVALPNCTLPAVLRPDEDRYLFMGEAIPSESWAHKTQEGLNSSDSVREDFPEEVVIA